MGVLNEKRCKKLHEVMKPPYVEQNPNLLRRLANKIITLDDLPKVLKHKPKDPQILQAVIDEIKRHYKDKAASEKLKKLINCYNDNGNTLLHEAAIPANSDLINVKMNVFQRKDEKRSLDCIKILVENGADTTLLSKNGTGYDNMTAYDIASSQLRTSIMNYLTLKLPKTEEMKKPKDFLTAFDRGGSIKKSRGTKRWPGLQKSRGTKRWPGLHNPYASLKKTNQKTKKRKTENSQNK